MNSLIRKWYFLTALSILFSFKVMASAETDFNKGLEYFKAGNYSSAVMQFEFARKQGMKSVALHYNLASSYYKLEEYSGAKHYFKLVSKIPSMKDLAEYNLGLVALKENNRSEAKQYFSDIAKSSDDKKLIRLSKKQLMQIKNLNDKWKIYVSANLGHDDNITASPVDTALGISDSFYDVYMSVDAVVSGKRKDGWMMGVTYFKIDFSDSDFYDEYQYAAGIRAEKRLAGWDASSHLTFSTNNFGGVDYQGSIKMDIKGKKSLSKTERLYLRYRYEDISSNKALFDYLEGRRQRARVEYRNYGKKSIKQVYYELELNDRNELVTTLYRYDYSPTRHTLRGKYTAIFSDTWHLIGDLSYRVSDFPVSTSIDRDDEQIKSSLSLDYRFDKTLKLRTRLQHTSNGSSVNQYDYDKTQITMGISKRF